MAALKKNEIVEAEIEGMTAEGSGVARVNDMVVFVPHAAPGDRLQLVISVHNKVTRVQSITITPSQERIVLGRSSKKANNAALIVLINA